jgi:hypothetical protein
MATASSLRGNASGSLDVSGCPTEVCRFYGYLPSALPGLLDGLVRTVNYDPYSLVFLGIAGIPVLQMRAPDQQKLVRCPVSGM